MSERTERIRGYLERIENRYNPEFDVPAGPQVTYTDYQLLEAFRALVDEVDQLTRKVETLTERLNEVEA